MPQQSFRHHYVPIWYQRRFLAQGQTAFKVLDMRPPVFKDRTGKVRGTGREVLDKGPDAHFWERDLYTTKWLGNANDDIERHLFGRIDKEGQAGIEALVENDWERLHEYYDKFFLFVDALRLRTPKGLLFTQRLVGPKSYNDLLMAMQQIRTMHCVMLAEGTREILTVPEGAARGLIFSDHPVTFYNRHVFPGDPSVPAGMDPLQQWQGTQTLFPLDRRHLAVFTHVEWAQKPSLSKARVNRTNARMFDTPLIRYDDWHRKRTLTEEQVLAVNYIIKSRARRYIAAKTEADLYPERCMKTRMWNKVGEFLMPPSRAVVNQVGYTVVGRNDGTFYFQDQFGRRPTSRAEHDREVERAKQMRAHLEKLLREHAAKKQAQESKLPD